MCTKRNKNEKNIVFYFSKMKQKIKQQIISHYNFAAGNSTGMIFLFLIFAFAIFNRALGNSQIPIICLFARPGAGKTTTANKVLNELSDCIGVDLDICISAELRENFEKGIYPNSAQRVEFMESACDYLESLLLVKQIENPKRYKSCLISFSFVNNDLRKVFRNRFPSAKWVLLDTSNEIAASRIEKRNGHFYKGAPIVESDSVENKRSEWEFAPIDFEHMKLDGQDSLESNSAKLFEIINSLTKVV